MTDSLGGVVSSFLGSIYAEVDVDFPADRLARKVGSFIPCALAGFLVAIQVLDPARCFFPAVDAAPSSMDSSDIPDEFQAHLSAYVDAYCRTTSNFVSAEDDIDFFRRYVIFAMLIQAVVAYLPYLLYFAACQSVVQPLINDAKEIAKLAEKNPDDGGADSGAPGAKRSTTVFPDDPEVLEMQRRVQLRLQCALNIFVKQRMPATLKQSLHASYWWLNVFGRVLAFALQAALLLAILLNYSFPSTARCEIGGAFDSHVNASSVMCVLPSNPFAKHFLLLDLVFVFLLPFASIAPYYSYVRNINGGFSRDVREAAAIFVDEALAEPFEEFASELLARREDDVVFVLALLYSNIDKFTAHQILITYQRTPKGEDGGMGIAEGKAREEEGGCCGRRRN